MEIAQDQVSTLKNLFGEGLKLFQDGQHSYILIPNQKTGGVDTESVDLLFCPTPWGGYNSKLFFSRKVNTTNQALNWNCQNQCIAGRMWFSFSWQVPPDASIVEKITIYLKAAK